VGTKFEQNGVQLITSSIVFAHDHFFSLGLASDRITNIATAIIATLAISTASSRRRGIRNRPYQTGIAVNYRRAALTADEV